MSEVMCMAPDYGSDEERTRDSGTRETRQEKIERLVRDRENRLREDLATPESRERVRGFYIEAMGEESEVSYLFRQFPREYSLEGDLLRVLDAFQAEGGADPYRAAIPDLKHLRRKAFQRYAFCLAKELNRRLAAAGQAGWWLRKDFLLPRIPLALLIGYGAMLDDQVMHWMERIGAQRPAAAIYALGCIAVSWLRIYLNVRDRIGDVPETAGRAWRVLGYALGWTGASVVAVRWFTYLDARLAAEFAWATASMTALGALLIAIAVQFFFAKSGSIADPL